MKLTGGKLIIRTAWLSNSNFGICYFKKICCPTNYRFLIQFVDLMIIKFSKIKMMVVEISFRLRLSGWCSDWITNWWRGGQIAPPPPQKKENRIVLCFKSLEWLITPRVISPRLDWFSCRYVHVVSLPRFLWSVHTCPIFCLNRWLRDCYDCFDSQIFYIVPISDLFGLNGWISKSDFRKQILRMIHDNKQKGIWGYIFGFFLFCSWVFLFFLSP